MEYSGNGGQFPGWVRSSKIEQATYEQDMYARRSIVLPSNQQLRVEYDGSNNPIYIGTAPRGLASSQDGWMLQKLTWVDCNMTLQQIAYGNWDNRASESYA